MLRIKSSHPASQGPFVIIDDVDFDPARHVLVDDSGKPLQAEKAPAAEKPAKAPKASGDPELAALRKQYKAKFGKGASPRWSVDQLKAKLAE